MLNVRTPVRRIDDAFIGGLLATVAVGDLSYLIGDASQGGNGRYFILVGRDKVLAHRRLIDPRGLGLSEERPLPTIKEVDDPVLARIWDPPVRNAQIDRALGNLGHVVEAEGRRWVFVYRELRRYGPGSLAGRPVLPDRGRDRRSRPSDQRRHRRRARRWRSPRCWRC